MEFIQYLNQRLAPATVKRYTREITLFSRWIKTPEAAHYQDIMNYLGHLRDKNLGSNLMCSLAALKKYYSYLLATGQRKDHPCKSIKLKDRRKKQIQLQDLFGSQELEQLLERKERYQLLKNRNKLILSLLIYQALTNGDLVKLQLADLNLEAGTIRIKAGRKTNGRTLKLKASQVYWLMEYLQKDRLKLLSGKTSDQLIIASNGTPQTREGISYLVETFKHLFPNRKLDAKTIRQSVITNLLKSGHDLRVVQAFAGHKYPSSTEQYQQTEVEELKVQVLKYHPLK